MLDEADEMLNMGFRDDMEKVIEAMPADKVQTLLYSATIPPWVNQVARKYLRPGYVIVDLVKNDAGKTNQGASTVHHIAMRTTHQVHFSSFHFSPPCFCREMMNDSCLST